MRIWVESGLFDLLRHLAEIDRHSGDNAVSVELKYKEPIDLSHNENFSLNFLLFDLIFRIILDN